MKNHRIILKRIVLLCATLAGLNASAFDFHVTTPQEFQNALTAAAANGADNNIWLTNGYYTGNFNYNSSAGHSLAVMAEAGLTSTNVTIDGAGGGRDLNISCPSSVGNVTVSNLTFLRHCGSYTIGALRIASSSGGATVVDGCRFLALTNSLGMGLEVASGLNTTLRNCAVIGKGTGTVNDGDGINISGVTGTTLIYSNTVSGNYVGDGADITASAVLTVSNNVFLGNYYHGLYFNPSSGSRIAQVWITNNVFNANSTNGNPSYDGVSINNFGTVNLGGNTFTGNRGGGAYCYNGTTVAVSGNTYYANGYYNGYYGGLAVYYVNTATVAGNTFSGNSGGYGGGGAYFNQVLTNLTVGNTFTGNTNYSSSGGGGACFLNIASGNVNIVSNNTFSANTIFGPGGAVSFTSSGGLVSLVVNTFTGNSCSGNNGGGAVYYNGSGSSPCTNSIIANTFSQNSSAYGGGAVYITGNSTYLPVTLILSDNLIVNNQQTGVGATGGGVFVTGTSNLFMVNNTVYGNTSAGGGGGTSFQVTGSVETLNVYNNIIWGNTATGTGTDVSLTGSGYNKLFMYNDANGTSGVWNNSLPQLNVDPKFFDPVNGDFHLQPASPCLNAGSNSVAFLPLTDLDGNVRTNNAGQVDLGCYQFNNTATHPADTNGNFVITAAEYTAYAAAWKAGQAWTSGPYPITANYVTRAGYLMTNGGTYHNDGSGRPVNWKVGP